MAFKPLDFFFFRHIRAPLNTIVAPGPVKLVALALPSTPPRLPGENTFTARRSRVAYCKCSVSRLTRSNTHTAAANTLKSKALVESSTTFFYSRLSSYSIFCCFNLVNRKNNIHCILFLHRSS